MGVCTIATIFPCCELKTSVPITHPGASFVVCCAPAAASGPLYHTRHPVTGDMRYRYRPAVRRPQPPAPLRGRAGSTTGHAVRLRVKAKAEVEVEVLKC